MKSGGYGDVWTFVAIDADSKLIPTWRVGSRDLATAYDVTHDLAGKKIDALPSRQTSITYKRAPKVLPIAAEQRTIFGAEDDEPA